MYSSVAILLQSLPAPSVWNFPNTIAIVSAALALIAAVLAYWPLHQQHSKQRLLEKSFGADFYDSATIKNSTKYYVRPFCSSVDPAQEAEMRQVIATQEDLFTAVDKHLINDTLHRHILLLADSGMGKSSFVLNYYARNQQLPRRKRQRLAVVPLGIPNALDAINKIDDKKNTVIFLDAFDEDTEAIKDHRSRLIQLMQACSAFKRVLITCRTQFFPKDEEIPKQTGIAVVGPRKPGESGVYEFWKLYLSPLNDDQVDEFIKLRYPLLARRKRKRARELVNKVPLLSVRPMLLSYIPDLMDAGADIQYSFQLYESMVENWLKRESRWVEKEVLRNLSEKLAVDLYVNREKRGAERIKKEELAQFVKDQNISLDDWKITGRSLLNRDAIGNYKFSHRSIMEYLFVKRFTESDPNCQGKLWTDYMKRFLLEMLHHSLNNHDLNIFTEGADLSNIQGIKLPKLLQPRSLPLNLSSSGISKITDEIYSLSIELYASDSTINSYFEEYVTMYDVRTGLLWLLQIPRLKSYWLICRYELDDMNTEKIGGFDNWRLPTLIEVGSLLHGGTVEKLVSHGLESIWTSDTYMKNPIVVEFNKMPEDHYLYRDILIIFKTNQPIVIHSPTNPLYNAAIFAVRPVH